jgi:glycosyltransferase involved in cell wall biosynthesis
MTNKSYSIIIPAYNSAEILPALCQELFDINQKENLHFEAVFVNDCSTDNTWEVIKELKIQNLFPITGISLSKNIGQHSTLWIGILHAKSDMIITIDDDLQFSPSDFPKLISKQIENDADLVYGTPQQREHSIARNFASKLGLYTLQVFLGTSTHGSSFRLFKKSLVADILVPPQPIFIDGIISPKSKNTTWINVSHNKRFAGKSGHRLLTQGLWTLHLIFRYKIKRQNNSRKNKQLNLTELIKEMI